MKELGVLVNRPLTNFKKATEILSEHFYNSSKGCSRGKSSLRGSCYLHFRELLCIYHQLSSEREKQTAGNRLKLRSIAETVFFADAKGLLSEAIRMICQQYFKILRVIMATFQLCCSFVFRLVTKCLKTT